MASIHNKIFLLILTSFLLVVFINSFKTEPLQGDLTRTGGFSESEFGWNKPIEVYENNLFKKAKSIEDYSEHYDIVVLGDSFTFNNKWVWLNYLVEKTGLSAIAFHVNKISIESIVNAKQYKSNPPLVFIYETVERHAFDRLLSLNGLSFDPIKVPSGTNSKLSKQIKYKPIHIEKKRENRKSNFDNYKERFSVTLNYMMKALLRTINLNTTEAVLIEMKNKSDYPLFSCNNNSEILIFKGDINKRYYSDNEMKESALNVKVTEEGVESNGFTNFIFLAFPDKLTVYSEFIFGGNNMPNALQRFSEHYNLIRLDIPFISAIKQGELDVYLPNDTHTGPIGSEIAAEEIMKKLLMGKSTQEN